MVQLHPNSLAFRGKFKNMNSIQSQFEIKLIIINSKFEYISVAIIKIFIEFVKELVYLKAENTDGT